MNKLAKGLLVSGVVVVAMGASCVACTAGTVSTVNDSIEQVEKEVEDQNKVVSELAKGMKWDIEIDEYGYLNATSVFKNTTDKEIEYLEFDYKVLDKDGVTLEDFMTNATNVKPGESVKLEIASCEEGAVDLKITDVKTSLY